MNRTDLLKVGLKAACCFIVVEACIMITLGVASTLVFLSNNRDHHRHFPIIVVYVVALVASALFAGGLLRRWNVRNYQLIGLLAGLFGFIPVVGPLVLYPLLATLLGRDEA